MKNPFFLICLFFILYFVSLKCLVLGLEHLIVDYGESYLYTLYNVSEGFGGNLLSIKLIILSIASFAFLYEKYEKPYH